jgi:hypothetical protein
VTVAYLLPCSCGSEIPVASAQAGGSVRCACGQEIEVPTLRVMTTLRSVGDGTGDPGPDVRAVCKRIGLLFLLVGAMVVSGAIAWLASLYAAQPKPPSLDRARPAWTIVIWRELRKGAEGPLFRDQVDYHKNLSDWESHRTIAVSMALGGAIVLLPGVILWRRSRPGRLTGTAR